MSNPMRIAGIRRQIVADARQEGRGPDGWRDFLAGLETFAAAMPAEGMPEPEFARRALPVMAHEHDALLRYLHRSGRIWRRSDGVGRRVFPQRPSHLPPGPGRPARSRPADAMEQEIHRAFSEGMSALVDAIDAADPGQQQPAAKALARAASRLVGRGVTWAAIRAALRIYRADALAILRRHETAFDPRSGECRIGAQSLRLRSPPGASLADRLLRAVEATGPRGALRSRLARVTSASSDDLAEALATLESEGAIISCRSRGTGQGGRLAVRYTLGDGRCPKAA